MGFILMKGIESNSKEELEKINKKINNSMKKNVNNLVGNTWGIIIKHPTQNKYLLKINEDSRNPLSYLSTDEKLKIKNHKMSNWKERDLMMFGVID